MASDSPAAPFRPGKVPIPRLPRSSAAYNTTKERRRVPRACTACRNHKIKCTGDTPRCKHCEATNRDCVYILPRKDRLKIITERCVQMAALLSALRSRTEGEENARIVLLLDAVEEDISEIRQTTPVPSIPDLDMDLDMDRSRGHKRTYNVRSSKAAEPLDPIDTESLDLLDEDLLKDDRARATGFVGKTSELQWLRSLMLQLERDDETASKSSERHDSWYGIENIEQVSAFNFYLNSDNVDMDFVIDPYELPAPETAERLLDSYMSTVHDSFPILPRKQFENEFRKFFQSVRTGTAPRLSPPWQAIMNLIFAIGAKHSHLVKARWQADEGDHLIYQARARVFGLNEFALTNHPDVPQIQVAGLLAFYYLCIGQISRAWVIMGVALRFAYSLGLHVRNEDPSASTAKREMLVRIWWSLYSLERLLSIVTGRPSVIVDSYCSVPLPVPFSEEDVGGLNDSRDPFGNFAPATVDVSSTLSRTFPVSFSNDMMSSSGDATSVGTIAASGGSTFQAIIQLDIITQNVLGSLYSVGTMIRSIPELQQDMAQLSQRLDQWVLSLPSEFNFQTHDPRPGSSFSTQNFHRERLLLGFHFCSARILLTRPCLFSLNQAQLATDLGPSTIFTHRMAEICVDAAKTVADFLPNQPNSLFIYESGPWWSIVHNMMQAVSVFLLALSYSEPGSQEVLVLSQYLKKLVRWLRMMKDPLAERAYQTALSTLEAVAGRLSLDISDLWMEHAMVYPNSNWKGTQMSPYEDAEGRLPHNERMMATAFTSFQPMPEPAFQQPDHDASFDSSYFHNK